jgi:hypothetical protein
MAPAEPERAGCGIAVSDPCKKGARASRPHAAKANRTETAAVSRHSEKANRTETAAVSPHSEKANRTETAGVSPARIMLGATLRARRPRSELLIKKEGRRLRGATPKRNLQKADSC